ncbi:G-type lectin S-receptor-like serine/threonine-protein kinase SD2-2 [Apostasia shenzhenica]|uniref:Receptor-like serine/threonine-protein kinase n=1 Tax=Apostasia shenzhenica TaxID=1088818 RepID=A0A2H9ZYQ7_9ASPA|nr:G-type lectin S-receptor-like serine/threonine-protein kinase SD2-2 [Apostasia shenzhenica]
MVGEFPGYENVLLPFIFFFLLRSYFTFPAVAQSPNLEERLQTLAAAPLIAGNSTILSPNQTFELGFFTVDGGSAWYLGIWYASIPIRTYVWVANRQAAVRDPLPSAGLTHGGCLAVADSSGAVLWQTDNAAPAAGIRLLDTGNLVLLSADDGSGSIVWQSFDFPADTWLPEMSVTSGRAITSWRSSSDPSPGVFSLRLRPPDFGEFELVFNGTIPYWSTGNWTGSRFAGVPEMTVPYIYSFRFSNPFTPAAEFDYSQSPLAESGLRPLLSRFAVDSTGQLMQYIWSPQAASWSEFWSRPHHPCRVYGRCGSLGLCIGGGLRPCSCPAGLLPLDPVGWSSGDFSGGCSHDCPATGGSCGCEESAFQEIAPIELDGAFRASFSGWSRGFCEDSCRKNCSCFGLFYNSESRLCTNLFGTAYNLRNSTSSPILYIKVSSGNGVARGREREKKWKARVLITGICVLSVVLTLSLAVLRRLRRRRRNKEDGEEGQIPVANLKVFTYNELSSATRAFSEKLGHGGFGAVFRGVLPDSTPVAVKRLERPGGDGDREFRAEVRTIGRIQHVNLVRLRGFCSEDSHRLLVYEYVPQGPLSAYLGGRHRRRSRPAPPLSWPVRFRIAVGTARAIAYLHEECHECIIHCDIKPENILLDSDFTPKVSDFGLSKLVGRDLSRVLVTTRGTWGYVAPEWISGVAITAKADVYSFGMTLLEIIGGRRNVDLPAEKAEEEGKEGWFFPPLAAKKIVEGDLGAVVEAGIEGYDVAEAERVGRVAVWCIQDDEAARPAMGTVVKMLQGTVKVLLPPLPKLLQALVAGESFQRGGIKSGSSSPCRCGGIASAWEISAENDEPVGLDPSHATRVNS